MSNIILVFIVPCFNEEEIIDTAYKKIYDYLQYLIQKDKISSESYISMIDDGSRDNSWVQIKNLKKVRGIKFTKNFGHQAAILAGLKENNADIYIPIDADLQDDISVAEEMIDKYNRGADIVFAIRKNRKNADNIFKRCTSVLFYSLLKIIYPATIPNCGDFCLLDKKVVTEVLNKTNSKLYLRGLIQKLDFKRDFVYYARQKRIGGTNKYTFLKSLQLAFNAFSFLKNQSKSNLKTENYYVVEEFTNNN